jgi:hypothetical protein
MKDWAPIRERYLRDELSVRLGGLAANLSRMKSFVHHEANRDALETLMQESQLFIEWTAAEASIDVAAELVELQVQLARWRYRWPGIWADPAQRRQVGEQAGAWSQRVLTLSGLMD